MQELIYDEDVHFAYAQHKHFDCTQCRQKGSATFLILIVGFFIAVAIGAFFLFKPSVPTLPQLVVKIPTNTSFPKPLYYNNEKLGLQFQYTVASSVKEDSEEEFNKRGNGNFRKNFANYVQYDPAKVLGAVVVLGKDQNFDTNPLSVWVFENPENLTPEDWFGKYWYYPFLWGVFDWTSKGHVIPDQEATISGQSIKYKIVTYQSGSPKYIYLSNRRKMYLLRVIGDIGDQILSGFELTQ